MPKTKTEPCPTCGKPFHWRRKLYRETGGYGQRGRPRTMNWDIIYALRDTGMSISNIAINIHRSRGIVQHALKARKRTSVV